MVLHYAICHFGYLESGWNNIINTALQLGKAIEKTGYLPRLSKSTSEGLFFTRKSPGINGGGSGGEPIHSLLTLLSDMLDSRAFLKKYECDVEFDLRGIKMVIYL